MCCITGFKTVVNRQKISLFIGVGVPLNLSDRQWLQQPTAAHSIPVACSTAETSLQNVLLGHSLCNIRARNVSRWDSSQIEFVCFGNLWTNVGMLEETPVTFYWKINEISTYFENDSYYYQICFSLTKPASFADCVGDELPMGWEQVLDPSRGVYYVNHGESKFRDKIRYK